MDDRDEKGRFIEGNKSKGARPKGSLSIKDTMRKYLDMKVKDIDPALVQQIAGKSKEFSKKYGNKTLREAMVIAYARKALAGDWTYLEHLEGKAPQIMTAEVTNKNIDMNEQPMSDDEFTNLKNRLRELKKL